MFSRPPQVGDYYLLSRFERFRSILLADLDTVEAGDIQACCAHSCRYATSVSERDTAQKASFVPFESRSKASRLTLLVLPIRVYVVISLGLQTWDHYIPRRTPWASGTRHKKRLKELAAGIISSK